jgi:uncharacterized protein YbaP (TraB family)
LELDDANEKRKHNKRNLNMALKIDELIQNSDERYMFAPGSLHCVGKFGMVSLLEGMGYKAERIIIHEPQ